MNIYRNWFLASRPWSFAMTAISVSVGSTLGAIDGSFSWALYLVTLFGTILLHAATNLINDYYDKKLAWTAGKFPPPSTDHTLW